MFHPKFVEYFSLRIQIPSEPNTMYMKLFLDCNFSPQSGNPDAACWSGVDTSRNIRQLAIKKKALGSSLVPLLIQGVS